jgi:hypothetical protein
MDVRQPHRPPAEPRAATLLRLTLVAALLVTAGGLAVPGHRGLFGPLALLVALAASLLPEREPPLQGPALAFAAVPTRPRGAGRARGG